jgi:hypothetical protein
LVVGCRDACESSAKVGTGAAVSRSDFSHGVVASGDRHSFAPLDRVEEVREVPGGLGGGHRPHIWQAI